MLIFLTALCSCEKESELPADTDIPVQETQETEGFEKMTEIRKLSSGAGNVTLRELSKPADNTRAYPTVSSMELEGYLEKMIGGNIDNWVLGALADNPNIIEQIENTGTQKTINAIIGDAFSQIANGIVSVEIDENRGFDGGHAIAVTSKKTGSYADIDYRIASIDGTSLDWRGAEEAWFYADASDYSALGTRIGFAIQEKNVDNNGNLTGDYESWGIKKGSEVRIYDINKNTGWETVKVSDGTTTDWNDGRISLPAGFVGWIAVTLDPDHMTPYWASNTMNNRLDLMDVNQFQICVEGNSASVGKTLYLSGYSVVGKGFGGELPVPGRNDDDTFETVVPLNNLQKGTGKVYTGGIMPWYDEFPGKLLTGMAFNYLLKPTAELKAAGDELSNALRDAQKENGYLGIYSGTELFGGRGSNWDVWGHYHMIYGLLLWHRVTGNEDAMTTAIRGADCVYEYFKDRTYDSAGSQTMNLGISHVFAELYKQTGDQRYLDEAIRIVEEDWPRSGNWMNNAFNGWEYYQSALPRWEALHTIITLGTLWEIMGTEKYYTALEDTWWSIAKTDRHNSGGFTSGEAACGAPYNTGAIETCCTIAWMALGSEYLQLSRNSVVADELELSYCNGMLGSLLDGEKYVTYNTPMEGGKRVASQTDISFQFNSGSPDFNCCQANVSRGMGEISQWAVLTDKNTVYLNFYGETVMNAKTPAQQAVKITETTSYPLDGSVRITVDGMGVEEVFTFALRIPAWAMGSAVTVDGETVQVDGGDYYRITRTWKNGDTVDLKIGMSFHVWTNEQNPTEASVYYGPILLAAKGQPFASGQPKISYKDFADAVIRLEDDGRHWLSMKINNENGEFVFYDYASAGKYYAYSTWFRMDNIPARKTADIGKTPIWCNTMLY